MDIIDIIAFIVVCAVVVFAVKLQSTRLDRRYEARRDPANPNGAKWYHVLFGVAMLALLAFVWFWSL